MATCSLWLFVLIAIVLHPYGAAQKKEGITVPRRVRPWQFMTSGIISLKLTTLELPRVTCTKAMATKWNFTALTLSQDVGFMTSRTWNITRVDYKAVGKIRPARVFTATDWIAGENMTYSFQYTIRECAVLKKERKNKTGEVYSGVWELWISDDNFRRNPHNEEFCRKHYMKFCKCQDHTKEYKTEECQGSSYKVILVA
uniref:Lipocalin n=1 Tax=Rhipicephalus zambeziensis TaxID=60191 RepID=A0A224YMU2_9ACAR